MAAKSSPRVVRRAGVASLSDSEHDTARLRGRDRLRRKGEFDRVLKSRVLRVTSPPFVALGCPSPTGRARIGLIVGKRHCARAVDRNRLKRLVRETFRVRRCHLPALDIVIQLVRAPDGLDVRRALDEVWNRIENRQQGRGE